MVKATGLGDQLLVGGNDVGGDINSIGKISGGNAPIEVTDITQSAHARLGGRRDGAIDFVSYFDVAPGASHAVFSALPTADTLVTYCHGYALGNPAASMVAKQVNYDGTRDQAGALTFAVSALANGYGLEWGIQASAGKRTDTIATAPATGYDMTTVSTAFGWQAYAMVTALTGTNVILTLGDSADNSSFTNLASGAFTSVTSAPAWQRLAGGATDTVRRYIRVASSGTFSSATFVVVFVRNLTATVF